jgi:phosphoribosyl-ATP pyrophosphohydrolase/phosphoribosyl-AMP cyclohydrolase
MSLDCDKDALLIKATPLGPTCHLGNESCFDEAHDNKLVFTLEVLEKIIDQRKNEDKSDSYVSSLFNKGVKEISKKLTEEAGETSISAVTADGRVVEESADLLFHLLVLLNQQGTNLEAVIKELEKRSSSAN